MNKLKLLLVIIGSLGIMANTYVVGDEPQELNPPVTEEEIICLGFYYEVYMVFKQIDGYCQTASTGRAGYYLYCRAEMIKEVTNQFPRTEISDMCEKTTGLKILDPMLRTHLYEIFER